RCIVHSTLACSWPGRNSRRLYRRAPIGKGQTVDERQLRRIGPGNTSVNNAKPAANECRRSLRWGSFGGRRCRRRFLKTTKLPSWVPHSFAGFEGVGSASHSLRYAPFTDGNDLPPILSGHDERFGALVWWARPALYNLQLLSAPSAA